MATTFGPVRCPLLIGRDDLLDLADRRLDGVVHGRGHFLLVAGEAGIGKSRFMEAVMHKADERGFQQSGGYLAPQDRDVPAASILDMARTMLRFPEWEALGRDLLELRDATLEAGAHRRQLVQDVVDRFLAMITRPTLLVFEDLQWADELSLEIMAELARRSRDRQLMLCAGYRTDEALPGTPLRDWRARWITQRIAEEVRLAPLDEHETALVTTLILDTGLPAPREVAAAVFQRTDGVPLHIEELLGALSAGARANGLAIRKAHVPETIEDAVLARLSHRSPEAQAVAKAGAIIGRCFTHEVLAGMMDLQPEAIEAPLQELIDNFVLEPPGPRDVYDFRHQLLRDAIYHSVPVAERRRFHARAAEFGAQLEGASEIHSSVHYERAGMGRQAFEAALAGAKEASRLAARVESFDLYRRAVENMPPDLDPAARAEILESFGGAAASIDDSDLWIEMSQQAAAAYREADMPKHALSALNGVPGAMRRDGLPISERRAIATALWDELAVLPEGPDVAFDATVRADVAVSLLLIELDANRLDDARAWLDTARHYAEASNDEDWLGLFEWQEGVLNVLRGDVSGGIRMVGDAASMAERAGHEMSGVSAFRDAAVWAARAMDYADADRFIAEGLRYADQIEQSHCAHVMSATGAMVAWADARWSEAAEQARQAVADHGCAKASNTARWALGYVLMGRGVLNEATVELSAALAFGERSETIGLILPPMWGLAEVAILRGEAERAFELCQEAVRRARDVNERILLAPFVVTGVRAAQAAGRPAAAAAFYADIAQDLAGLASVAEAPLAHGRGLVLLADGGTGVAKTALEAAVRGWDAKGRVWEATWARLDLAYCLIRSNRFADGLAIAVEARGTGSRLNSRSIAERADALARMARGRVAADEPWRPLTAREYAVARLISEGMTNAEIADQLGIAPKTASSHVEHILAKLGAARRAEIATWASNVERSTGASNGSSTNGVHGRGAAVH